MSEREIPAKVAGQRVVVGWDDAVRTYFARVSSGATGAPALYIGIAGDERKTPEELVEPLRRYADLTPEILAALRADRFAHIGKGPAELQGGLLDVEVRMLSVLRREQP